MAGFENLWARNVLKIERAEQMDKVYPVYSALASMESHFSFDRR